MKKITLAEVLQAIAIVGTIGLLPRGSGNYWALIPFMASVGAFALTISHDVNGEEKD